MERRKDLERWDGVLDEHLEVCLIPLSGFWGWLEGCGLLAIALMEEKLCGKGTGIFKDLTYHRPFHRKSRSG
jgi:hypothetical protein